MGEVQVSVHLDGQDEWRVRLLGEDRACFAAIDLVDSVTLMTADPDLLRRFADRLTRTAAELAARHQEQQLVADGPGVVV